MNDAGYKRWANTEWWQEGYERLWLGKQRTTQDGQDTKEESKNSPGKDGDELRPDDGPTDCPVKDVGEMESDVGKTVVYLTADSEEELTELKEDETYIIGGICDHNRYKVNSSPSYVISTHLNHIF
jgi:tRNA (guanine9-N1)-methyltransferase